MFDNLLRGLTQNRTRLDPQSPDPCLRPIECPKTIDAILDKTLTWVDNVSHWSLVKHESSDGQHRLHLTRRTKVLAFIDDVHVTIARSDDGDACVVNADSQSRVGKGDLGQNARNLKELRTALTSDQK